MNSITFYEWMLLNGAELAKNIVKEQGLNGPIVDKMLSEAQMLDGPRNKAKKLLRQYLKVLGGENFLPQE